jgi:ankyrin repeat protein
VTRHQKLASICARVEQELRRLGQWEGVRPPADRFENMGAFGGNTLPFSSWLQHVFLPRAQEVILQEAPIPDSTGLGTYAVRNLDGPDEERLSSLLCELAELSTEGVEELCAAAQQENTEALTKILNSGVLVNAQSHLQIRALEYAANRGATEAARLLLAHGALVTVNALTWAATAGAADVLELLLGAGMKSDSADSYGVSALFFAAAGGDSNVTSYLLHPEEKATRRTSESTHCPVNHERCIELLVNAGADVNRRFLGDGKRHHGHGATPLMVAAAFGRPRALRRLLDLGADPALRDDQAASALDHAQRNDRADCVTLLAPS